MRKITLLLTGIIFTLLACEKDPSGPNDLNKVTVRGHVQKPKDEGHVVLYDLNSQQPTAVDTIILDENNDFEVDVVVEEPGFYGINFFQSQLITLILNDKDLQVTVDGDKSGGTFEVSGSEDMTMYVEFVDGLKRFQEEEQNLREMYTSAAMNEQKRRTDSIGNAAVDLNNRKIAYVKEHIKKMDGSLAALAGVDMLPKEGNYDLLKGVVDNLAEKYPENNRVLMHREALERVKSLAIGKVAPDFTLPDPEGNMVSLSSFRGNYVLVDFWAGWCQPCRRENPNIVAAYNKYRDEGFEVLGVSLDRTRDRWINAIEEDGLEWTQVSDLQYFDSEVVELYNIRAIPFSLLLDKEGKIVAKNLRGASLDEKLREIFGES